jgi:hypothetical protein
MKQRILYTLLGFLIFNLAFGQTGKIPESKLNKELVAILDTIHQEDQKYREEAQELEKKYGWESKKVQDVWEIIHVQDSINLIKVEKILADYGWLGVDVVGQQGNSTLFLVIQHSNTQTQVKYLPMLKEAVKNGKAKPSEPALMEDRVLLAQGEKQIYGSQLTMNSETNKWELEPMIDPDNADKRRSEVGLKPLADYLKYWDLTWDVEKFKKRMEVYDAEKNKK